MIRPGVPTTIRVTTPLFPLSLLIFRNSFTCGSFDTPPKTATLPIPKGAPSAERVSCVWMASSRVGATTRVVMLEEPLDLGAAEVMRRDRAGMPKARVFPLISSHCQNGMISLR